VASQVNPERKTRKLTYSKAVGWLFAIVFLMVKTQGLELEKRRCDIPDAITKNMPHSQPLRVDV
jgi:hypothetical protein